MLQTADTKQRQAWSWFAEWSYFFLGLGKSEARSQHYLDTVCSLAKGDPSIGVGQWKVNKGTEVEKEEVAGSNRGRE